MIMGKQPPVSLLSHTHSPVAEITEVEDAICRGQEEIYTLNAPLSPSAES